MMSFDRTTRNALARMVGQARELLKFDVMDQLRRLGFQADGSVLTLDQIAGLSELDRMAGRELNDLLEHFVALESGPGVLRRQAAYDRLAREIGFTTLNRLVALRMAEERGLIVQAVGRGLASDGFQIYERVARDALGNRAETYRAYLECLYGELALDLPMLFDRMTPESRIFPSERCLQEVLTLLNNSNLAHLWKEDEAIGWVYQYYNDPDERKKMREAQAPRNSRELAVRNQFFTPRYVVEFLADNTLGHLWYEMQHGNTQLSNQCRYLVCRPVETFLQDGEEAPQAAEPEEDLSPEELLNRPVFIPFRAKKDPRDLKILDPACGSGHFLLYAFDLLETIYEEAWADSDSPISAVTGTRLRNDYADLGALRQAVPGLIVHHNLYGIDIDPRACQIAALALWLRAQRCFQKIGLEPAKRLPITKGNLVCAESMPGERDMLAEYMKDIDMRLQPLVQTIWEKMQLAGEAGSLLKIEEEIDSVLTKAREEALVTISPVQVSIVQERAVPTQLRLNDATNEARTFWEEAEEKLLTTLHDYSRYASNGHAVQRRLFAEDAAQGFAFVNLCRNRFDVVLMNPPFGSGTAKTNDVIERFWALGRHNIATAFVEQARGRIASMGTIGMLITRAPFFNSRYSDWRHTTLFNQNCSIQVIADLGQGVLDSAMVECVAAVLGAGQVNLPLAFDCRSFAGNVIPSMMFDAQKARAFSLSLLEQVPNMPLSYWPPTSTLTKFAEHGIYERLGEVKQGLATKNNEQYVRLWWEVPATQLGNNKQWRTYAKGGEYARYYLPLVLVVDWSDAAQSVYQLRKGQKGVLLTNKSDHYLTRLGLTFSKRSQIGFSVRVMPKGTVFSQVGPGIFPSKEENLFYDIAFFNSEFSRACIDFLTSFGSYSEVSSLVKSYL